MTRRQLFSTLAAPIVAAAVLRPEPDVKLEKAVDGFCIAEDPWFKPSDWKIYYIKIYYIGSKITSLEEVSLVGSNIIRCNIRSGFKLQFDGGSSISSPVMYGTAQSSKG